MILIIDNIASRFNENYSILKKYIDSGVLSYVDSFSLSEPDIVKFDSYNVAFIHESYFIESLGSKLGLYDELVERQRDSEISENINFIKFSGKGADTNLSKNFISDKDLYNNISFFINEYSSSGKLIYDLLKFGKNYLIDKILVLKEKILIYKFNNEKKEFYGEDNELIKDLKLNGIIYDERIDIADIINKINKKIDTLIYE